MLYPPPGTVGCFPGWYGLGPRPEAGVMVG
jgi:hypothetical protein